MKVCLLDYKPTTDKITLDKVHNESIVGEKFFNITVNKYNKIMLMVKYLGA